MRSSQLLGLSWSNFLPSLIFVAHGLWSSPSFFLHFNFTFWYIGKKHPGAIPLGFFPDTGLGCRHCHLPPDYRVIVMGLFLLFLEVLLLGLARTMCFASTFMPKFLSVPCISRRAFSLEPPRKGVYCFWEFWG